MQSTRLLRSVMVMVCVYVLCASAAFAADRAPALRLPRIFGDDMALQSGAATPVWGWAEPGGTVTVTLGSQKQTAKAAANGKWLATLRDLVSSKESQTMTVTDGATTITFKNLLIGDVWVGSGQSNMEMGVGGCTNAGDEIAKSACDAIRIFRVNTKFTGMAKDDVDGRWFVCSPQHIGWFSAALYFFGREIHLRTGTPLGLIQSAVGGTNIERWISPEAFKATPGLEDWAKNVAEKDAEYRAAVAAKAAAIDAWWRDAKAAVAAGAPIPPSPLPEHPQDNATTLYNGMIHPIIPFGIKGVIWYQGESNGGEEQSYIDKTKALVEGWRALWGRGDFHFYWVQLANFQKPGENPEGGDGWAKIRDAQRRALAIPNTGMASAIDLADADNPDDIHPKNKQDVGIRLALWALRDVYGKKDVVPSGPLFKELKIAGNKAVVSFDCVGGGLMVGKKVGLEPAKEVKDGALAGFAIAGEDRKWVWANARIEGGTVVLTSDRVPNPVAARYAFTMNPATANLYNKEGLPASPFRSDKW